MRELAPGTVFAGHRIDAVAGRGGMGWVYRAAQLALDRTVALKVIAPDLTEDPTVRERFLRESKIAASIDHPNVIPIYYAGEEDGVAYLAMRYVGGDDLRSLVRREQRLDPRRAAAITRQVANALDAAHVAGLVHRDVKPANVLLGPEDHVYLTDFGLTKHALSASGQTGTGQWVGTLDYVSPEQIRGERVDARTDVYALGCLLFFSLTGQVPFKREGDEARLWAHLTEPPPKPSEHGAPAALDAVVARAMAKSPSERYPSAGDLGRAAVAAAEGREQILAERVVARGAAAPIEEQPTQTVATRLLGSERDTAPQPSPPEQPPRRRLGALAKGLIVALVLAAAAGAIVAMSAGDGDGDPQERATATASPTATASAQAVAGEQIDLTDDPQLRPNGVAILGGTAWVILFNGTRVLRVDLEAKQVRRGPRIGRGAEDVLARDGQVWAAVARDHKVVRIDAGANRIVEERTSPNSPSSLVLSGGALWSGEITSTAGGSDQLVELDPRTLEERRSIPFPRGVRAMSAAPDGVLWILERRANFMVKYDTRAQRELRRVPVGDFAEDVQYAGGFVWVAQPQESAVLRLDQRTGARVTVSVGGQPRQLLARGADVWTATYGDSQVVRIDAEEGRRKGEPVEAGLNAYALDAYRGSVWVTGVADGTLTEVDYTP